MQGSGAYTGGKGRGIPPPARGVYRGKGAGYSVTNPGRIQGKGGYSGFFTFDYERKGSHIYNSPYYENHKWLFMPKKSLAPDKFFFIYVDMNS